MLVNKIIHKSKKQNFDFHLSLMGLTRASRALLFTAVQNILTEREVDFHIVAADFFFKLPARRP
jgi:hypothetical protein